jgi:hypothetical protein
MPTFGQTPNQNAQSYMSWSDPHDSYIRAEKPESTDPIRHSTPQDHCNEGKIQFQNTSASLLQTLSTQQYSFLTIRYKTFFLQQPFNFYKHKI